MAKEKSSDIEETHPISNIPKSKGFTSAEVTFAETKPNRLCFIVTKNKRRTWAEDLYACELKKQEEQIYH